LKPDFNSVIDYKYKIIICNDTLRIKGEFEITEYENDVVVLRCGGDNICIRGIEISINLLNCDEICISGKLAGISFNYREDFD